MCRWIDLEVAQSIKGGVECPPGLGDTSKPPKRVGRASEGPDLVASCSRIALVFCETFEGVPVVGQRTLGVRVAQDSGQSDLSGGERPSAV